MLYGYGIERSFRCHVHDDHTASASVNSANGLWFCYACGAKGKFDVMEVPNSNFSRALIRMMERKEKEGRVYPENYLDVYDSMGPGEYWLSRFTEEICRTHRLGQDPDRQFATYPVRDISGNLLGISKRDLTGQDRAKYRYPDGVKMASLLFNYHRSEGDVLMITEGATDAIAAEEAGWSDVVATYSNRISQDQMGWIRRYDPKLVLVAYDQDAAGEQGYGQALNELYRNRIKADRLVWDTYKDLASIPLSERSDMMSAVSEQLGVRVDKGCQGV